MILSIVLGLARVWAIANVVRAQKRAARAEEKVEALKASIVSELRDDLGMTVMRELTLAIGGDCRLSLETKNEIADVQPRSIICYEVDVTRGANLIAGVRLAWDTNVTRPVTCSYCAATFALPFRSLDEALAHAVREVREDVEHHAAISQ